MLLNEFFGKNMDIDKSMSKNNEDKQLQNDLFWFIIDHNKLHKDFFHPIGAKINKHNNTKTIDKEAMVKEFLPMVNKGCKEFYHHSKMPGRFEDNFDKEFVKEMCERLYDHYKDDIVKGQYKLGS
jgi:hypothetical protein